MSGRVPITAHHNCKICGIKLEFAVPVYSDRCCDITGGRLDTGKPDFEAMANTSATCAKCNEWAHMQKFTLLIMSGKAWAPEAHNG